jgi:hypothetical protein
VSRSATAFLLAGLASLVACTGETSPETHAADKTATSAAAPADAKPLEAGCASCVFAMEGVEGCRTAVMVDGKPYLVKGVAIDAMALDLCDEPRTVLAAGSVQGGEFVATSFTLKP